MNISELITDLQHQLDSYGDMDVTALPGCVTRGGFRSEYTIADAIYTEYTDHMPHMHVMLVIDKIEE